MASLPPQTFHGYQMNATGALTFVASARTLQALHSAKGYVYVLARDGFVWHCPTEWRSSRPVEPVEVTEVSVADLSFPIVEVDDPVRRND
jgi:hypothetical protein